MTGSRGPFVSGLDMSANRQGATDLDVSIVPRIGRRRGLRALAVVHLLVGLIIEPIGKVRKILGQAARCSDRLDDLKLWLYLFPQWFAHDCNCRLGKLAVDADALDAFISLEASCCYGHGCSSCSAPAATHLWYCCIVESLTVEDPGDVHHNPGSDSIESQKLS